MFLAHWSTEMVCVYILCHQEIRDQGDMCSDFIGLLEQSLKQPLEQWLEIRKLVSFVT